MSHRPSPVTDDFDTGGFFAAAAEGRLVVRACASCSSVLHLPKAYCHHCGGWDTEWVERRARGSVYSYTVVEHQVHQGFPVPHTIALVSLDDEPAVRFMAYLPGRPEIQVGTAVEMFIDDEPMVPLPNWRLAPTSYQEEE